MSKEHKLLKGFYKLDRNIIFHIAKGLDGIRLAVWLDYACRGNYKEGNKAHPSRETLADDLGYSITSIARISEARTWLQEKGYLKLDGYRNSDGEFKVPVFVATLPCIQNENTVDDPTVYAKKDHGPCSHFTTTAKKDQELKEFCFPPLAGVGDKEKTTDSRKANQEERAEEEEASAAALAVGLATKETGVYLLAQELCKVLNKCLGNKEESLEANTATWIQDAIEIISDNQNVSLEEIIKPVRHALLRNDDDFWQKGKLSKMKQVKKSLHTLITQFATIQQRVMERNPTWSFDYEAGWKGAYKLKAGDYFATGPRIWKVKGKGFIELIDTDADSAASLPGIDNDGNPREAQEGYIDCTPPEEEPETELAAGAD